MLFETTLVKHRVRFSLVNVLTLASCDNNCAKSHFCHENERFSSPTAQQCKHKQNVFTFLQVYTNILLKEIADSDQEH